MRETTTAVHRCVARLQRVVVGNPALLSCFMLWITAGCAGSLVTSNWREEQITIDGDAKDWSDSAAFVGNDHVGVKVTNDGDFFYFLLVTQKREIARQVALRGLTLWFDPNGGENRTIGVHYPVGMMGMGGRSPQGQNEPPERTEQGEEMVGRGVQEIEFFGPTTQDRMRFPKNQGKGIEAEFGQHDNLFVYEAKVPLIFSLKHPYAIETSTGSTIGLTIAIGGREFMGRGDMGGGFPGGGGRGRGGGGGRGGGMGGGRVGGGGFGGQRPGGSGGAQFEPIKIKVRLAEAAGKK